MPTLKGKAVVAQSGGLTAVINASAAAMDGVSGKMITLVRNNDSDRYVCTTGLADLEDVANGEKILPPEFIDANGTGITEAFRQYALPLIQGEVPLEVGGDGLPVYARLDRTPVAKLTSLWGDLQWRQTCDRWDSVLEVTGTNGY